MRGVAILAGCLIVVVMVGVSGVHGFGNRGGFLGTGFCAIISEAYPGYNCTEYRIATLDGFLLTMQNIMWRKGKLNGETALFLHSSLLGGDSWFYNPNPTPLAMAYAGYNVWIGNFRGTRFSLAHLNYTRDMIEFWDWCIDDLATYDLIAFIRNINTMNGDKPVHVIAYGQGAAVAVSALSLRPRLIDRVKSIVLMSPIVYLRNVISPIVRTLASSDLWVSEYQAGAGQFGISVVVGDKFWDPNINMTLLGSVTLTSITGPNCCIRPETVFGLFTSTYAYTSYKNLAYLSQGVQRGTFTAFDYRSASENLKRYYDENPPTYSLQEIPEKLPMMIFHGGMDQVSTPLDVQFLMKTLKTRPSRIYIPRYAHLDMIFSYDVGRDINGHLLKFVAKHW